MFLPNRAHDEEWLGIVVAVPEPWVSQIAQARITLGDKIGQKVPPHITLMPPIAVPKQEKEAVVEHLRAVAARHRPFKITISGSGSFLPVSPVVYLEVAEGGTECTNLARDLMGGPLQYTPRFPYHPHITLAQNVSQESLEHGLKVAEKFHASWVAPGFRLDRVSSDGSYMSAALFDFTGTKET